MKIKQDAHPGAIDHAPNAAPAVVLMPTPAGQAALATAQALAKQVAAPATLRAYKADWTHLPNGAQHTGSSLCQPPSRDTFSRLFRPLDPEQFRAAFLHFMARFSERGDRADPTDLISAEAGFQPAMGGGDAGQG